MCNKSGKKRPLFEWVVKKTFYCEALSFGLNTKRRRRRLKKYARKKKDLKKKKKKKKSHRTLDSPPPPPTHTHTHKKKNARSGRRRRRRRKNDLWTTRRIVFEGVVFDGNGERKSPVSKVLKHFACPNSFEKF